MTNRFIENVETRNYIKKRTCPVQVNISGAFPKSQMSKKKFNSYVMKKLLLLAFIAFSLNAFAQSNSSANILQISKTNTMEKSVTGMMQAEYQTPGMFMVSKPERAITQQLPEQPLVTQLIDSIYHWQWDTTIMGWNLKSKTIDMIYDNNNNLTGKLNRNLTGSEWVDDSKMVSKFDLNNNWLNTFWQKWDNSAWVNLVCDTMTYNARNKMTSDLLLNWNGNSWFIVLNSIFTYNASGNLISKLMQGWDGTNWFNYMFYTYTYDANNNQLSYLSQRWDDPNWSNSTQVFFSYDANYNLINTLVQSWDGSVWIDNNQRKYTYDFKNNKIKEVLQLVVNGVLQDMYQYEFTYDANNMLTYRIDKSWDKTKWMNYKQYAYTYDSNKNQTSEFVQKWDGSNWLNFSQSLKVYDANNFTNNFSSKKWNSAGTKVLSGDSTCNYYNTGFNGIPGLKDGNVSVYPNPSRGKITLSSNSAINAVEIFSLSGKRVYADYNLKPQTSNDIDLTGYAKGIYIMKVHNGAKVYISKVVVQ